MPRTCGAPLSCPNVAALARIRAKPIQRTRFIGLTSSPCLAGKDRVADLGDDSPPQASAHVSWMKSLPRRGVQVQTCLAHPLTPRVGGSHT